MKKAILNRACDDCQFEGGDHQTDCKHYVPTKWDIEKGKAVPAPVSTMKNKLPDIKHKDLHFACLCAGLRRRNAGLCLKCEIEKIDGITIEQRDGTKVVLINKDDILRLLEQ